MAEAKKNQTKISALAKDLGIKSKELTDVLAASGIEGKTSSASLDPDEFNLIMSTLTERAQVDNIGDYLDGKSKIIIEVPKKDTAKAEEQKKAAPATAEVKKEESKAEEPKAPAAKAEEVKKAEPKAEEPKKSAPKTEVPAKEAPKTERGFGGSGGI